MATPKLTAQARPETGKGSSKKMRREGKIPAVLYGKKQESLSLTLDDKDVSHLLAKPGATTNVLDLEITQSGKNVTKNVLVKKIQKHPYRDQILHMDFLEVAMDKDITVLVPIEVTGESRGVKEGGILELKRRELEVTCLPGRIPHTIVIDTTPLMIGDVVHVEDITPPEGVQILHETNFPLLSIVVPAAEISAEAAAEAEEEEKEAGEKEAEKKEKEEESGD